MEVSRRTPVKIPSTSTREMAWWGSEEVRKGLVRSGDYQAIRADFQELYDDCRGDMRKLMCHPRQHILAKLVHKMRIFRDEDGEYLFDTQLDLLPFYITTLEQVPNGCEAVTPVG
jgi:hypothetical protein